MKDFKNLSQARAVIPAQRVRNEQRIAAVREAMGTHWIGHKQSTYTVEIPGGRK